MRPTSITLTNFKSIGENAQRIELAPITLLFGPNSAGKSTVLQSLIYLREVLIHRNYDPDKTTLGGDWLDLGGFKNLVHGHDPAEAIEIAIGFDIGESEPPDYLTDHERDGLDSAGFELPEVWLGQISEIEIKLTIRWSERQDRPTVEAFESWIDGQRIARIVSSADGKQIYLEELDLSHPAFSLDSSGDDDDDALVSDFRESFAGLINPSVTTQVAYALESSLGSERPFLRASINELEELLDGVAKGQPGILRLIAEELGNRTSRRAAELAQRATARIENSEKGRESLGYIGLDDQKDALPNSQQGLCIDESVWSDDTGDSEFDQSALRLLSNSLISGFVAGPLLKVNQWLETFSYIGPLRDLPPRNLQPQLTPEKSRWAKGLAAWELLHHASAQLIEEINYWLSEKCLKTGYQVVVHRYRELSLEMPLLSYLDQDMDMDQQLTLKNLIEEQPINTRMTLREEESGLEVMPQDIGVGISQLFPVVVLTISHQSGLIAIEQPELHLHPAIQVELADLFARYAIKHNKIMLLETHSEHLMLRLLRRIRERHGSEESLDGCRLDKNSVSVQYVEPSVNGTQFKRKRIDDVGDFLDEWPGGFFEERDEELFF